MKKVFIGVLLLAVFVIAVLNVSASNMGISGWRLRCQGIVTISDGSFMGEARVRCDNSGLGDTPRDIGWVRFCGSRVNVPARVIIYALPTKYVVCEGR